VAPGFSETDYTGNEGGSCRMSISIPATARIDQSLTLRLIPRTFAENAALNGPPIPANRQGINANSKTM